jgi:hypothetical protein
LSAGTGNQTGRHDIVIQHSGQNCNLINFEGGGCDTPIGVVPGDVTVTFGTSWLSLIDFDAGTGCSGNFANEPTPETIAYFLDKTDISIGLSPPVQFIELFYVASAISLPVTVTAFDAGNNVIDTAVGNTVGTNSEGADCTGDPNGVFCLFDTITLTAGTDVITRITIEGSIANQFGIDNLQFCTEAEELNACCLPNGSCSEVSQAGCEAAGGQYYPGQSCGEVGCGPTPVDNTSWGRVKSVYRD